MKTAFFSLVTMIFIAGTAHDALAGDPSTEVTGVYHPQRYGLYTDLYLSSGILDGPKGKKWKDMYLRSMWQEFIDGVTIVGYWKDVEPENGKFNWNILDGFIINAVEANKKIAIGIISGNATPDWVYAPTPKHDAGVTKLTFDVFDYDWPGGVYCKPLSLPAFWEPAYIDDYNKLMLALSDHLKSLATEDIAAGDVYKAVTLVKLAGIGRTTEELMLEAHPPGEVCHDSKVEVDGAAVYAAAGYRPLKVINAWKSLASGTAAAFPDKMLVQAVIPNMAFPPINEDGEIDANANYHPPRPDPMAVTLMEVAVRNYGRRIMLQWDALYNTVSDIDKVPPQLLAAASITNPPAQIGWQLNGFGGMWGGSGCIYPKDGQLNIGACRSVDDFESIFDNGMYNNGTYFEVHPQNIIPDYQEIDGGLNYRPAIFYAHRNFWASGS